MEVESEMQREWMLQPIYSTAEAAFCLMWFSVNLLLKSNNTSLSNLSAAIWWVTAPCCNAVLKSMLAVLTNAGAPKVWTLRGQRSREYVCCSSLTRPVFSVKDISVYRPVVFLRTPFWHHILFHNVVYLCLFAQWVTMGTLYSYKTLFRIAQSNTQIYLFSDRYSNSDSQSEAEQNFIT